jgi:hypothetical protein
MSNRTQLLSFLINGAILIACKADVFAPESTRALIVGIPISGKEHHSSLPRIILLSDIHYFFILFLETKSKYLFSKK